MGGVKYDIIFIAGKTEEKNMASTQKVRYFNPCPFK